MRRGKSVAAALVLVLGICLAGTMGLSGGVESVGAAEGEELLAAVLLGCDTAASRFSTSGGTVTVHEWAWRSNGELLETETRYRVASAGEKFKAAVETVYITNEWTPPERDMPIINTPGTVQRQEIAYDGEKVTSYELDRKRAEIAGPDSGAGRELRTVKLMSLSPGHALPRLAAKPPSVVRTRSGPYVVGREVVNGEECIVIEVVSTLTGADSDKAYSSRFWVMPHKGFSVYRSEHLARGGKFGEGTLLAQGEIETRLYGDELWGISEVRNDQYRLDDSGRRYLSDRTVTTFADDYQLNPPVTEEMLTITLPSGTRVHNELIDTEYTVP